MKKMFVLTALSLCVLGSFASVYADANGSTAPVCAYSSDEQAFADKLTDANKMVFCGMTSSDRAACMSMVGTPDQQGNPMSPDQAVLSMVGSGS